jgi:hypothetical protein
MKLSKLQEEYVPTRPILYCLCEKQTCSGKFLQIKHWQRYCQWECLRLGLATRMDLKYNIYINMKLTLTIQELEEPKTKDLYKGIFGTLILDSHKEEHAEAMLEWAEKDKLYREAIEKDENSPAIQPAKPILKGINFALNIKSVPGFEEIINQLITDAVNLDKKEKFEKARADREAKNKAEEGDFDKEAEELNKKDENEIQN